MQVPELLNYRWPEEVLTVDSNDHDWFETLEDLANRPYWSRIWAIQEMLVARQVHIYCSGQRIDGSIFLELLQSKTKTDLLDGEVIDEVSRSAASRKYKALPLMLGRHPDRNPDLQQPLYDMLLGHSRAKCGDARDRVFDSHDLFRALGIVSSKKAGKLLRDAKRFYPLWDADIVKGQGPMVFIDYVSFELQETSDEDDLLDLEDEAGAGDGSDQLSDVGRQVDHDPCSVHSGRQTRSSWLNWIVRKSLIVSALIACGLLARYTWYWNVSRGRDRSRNSM